MSQFQDGARGHWLKIELFYRKDKQRSCHGECPN
jgi:hypothetical protein